MEGYDAIQTYYGGYKFRSRLEARWALFFDELGIEYEYEPEGINEEGTYYLPDFYLPDFSSYFEVKRKGLTGKEKDIAIKKISYGTYTASFSGMITFGDPVDDDILIFCQESDDGGGGSYEHASVTIGIHPDLNQPWLFSYDDHRDRCFYPYWSESAKSIPMNTTEYGKYRYEDFVDYRVISARYKARQARFEYRETPEYLGRGALLDVSKLNDDGFLKKYEKSLQKYTDPRKMANSQKALIWDIQQGALGESVILLFPDFTVRKFPKNILDKVVGRYIEVIGRKDVTKTYNYLFKEDKK